jgi:hypothetical protein
VPQGVCIGASGRCLTATATSTITRTFTQSPTVTPTPTRTFTPTFTSTPELGEFATDPFKCYRLKQDLPKFEVLENLLLVDEFDSKMTKVIRPTMLCNPADLAGQGIQHPDEFLLCFKIRDMRGQPRFQRKTGLVVRNQLGEQIRVTAVAPGLLCVPSRLVVGRKPTATPAPTATPPPPTPTV